MPTFVFIGDITHAGRVEVEADTIEEAIEMAQASDCQVTEEDRNFVFSWNGDVDSVEVME